MLLNIVLLLVGFVLLVKGADFFIDGSSAVAKRLKVPSIVIGLTIVAIGTSLPELAVSTVASAKGANALAFSNVAGSNIFNLLMVLGISSLFISVNVKKSILKREFPFLIIITAISLFFAGDVLWFGGIIGKVNIFKFKYNNEQLGEIGRIDGIVLVLLFVFFIWWTVNYALKERDKHINSSEIIEKQMSVVRCIIYIVGGAAGIVAGGELVVNSAKSIALAVGMSETLVGLTIVALGTSLPELVTSAVAAKKGEADLAVGNVIGSNISNLLMVLGVSATISPIPVTSMALIDTMILLIVTVIVFIFATTCKQIRLKEGIVLVLIYFAYMAYIICRQM